MVALSRPVQGEADVAVGCTSPTHARKAAGRADGPGRTHTLPPFPLRDGDGSSLGPGLELELGRARPSGSLGRRAVTARGRAGDAAADGKLGDVLVVEDDPLAGIEALDVVDGSLVQGLRGPHAEDLKVLLVDGVVRPYRLCQCGGSGCEEQQSLRKKGCQHRDGCEIRNLRGLRRKRV